MVDKSTYSEFNATQGGWYRKGGYVETSHQTPDYHGKVARGEDLPINPYFFRRWDLESAYEYTYNGYRSDFHAHSYPYTPHAVFDAEEAPMFGPVRWNRNTSIPSLKREADAHLRTRLASTELDLGVMLAELPETIGFVTESVGRLYKGYRHLRRGNVRAGLEALTGKKPGQSVQDFAADKWLEYSYAVKPLVSDVYDVVDYFDRSSNGRSRAFWTRGFAQAQLEASADTGDTNPDPGNYNQIRGSIRGTARVEAAVRMVITNPTLYSLAQLGVTNPALIAWELVPFSFVVDWILPIGNYLQQWQVPPGLTFKEGYRYTKYSGTIEGTTDIGGSAYSTEWHTSRFGTFPYKHREVLSDIPEPRFQYPDFSNPLSKLASGLALLVRGA